MKDYPTAQPVCYRYSFINSFKAEGSNAPVIDFFLNRHFWCQKHHFKPKKRIIF
jgi:hypothetical protein